MDVDKLRYPVGTKLWLAPRPCSWATLVVNGVQLDTPAGWESAGFAVFYDSRESYDRDWPDLPPMEFTVMENINAGEIA